MQIIDLTQEKRYLNGFTPESLTKMNTALINERHPCYPHLDFYSHRFSHESNRASSLNDHGGHNVYDFANQVPVFFVTKELAGQQVTIDFLGHSLDVVVPDDKLPRTNIDIDNLLKSQCEIDIDDFIKRGHDDFDQPKKSILDLWGVYVAHSKSNPNMRDGVLASVQPMIFIWVDKIFEYVKEEYQLFNILTSHVILHEMMHALMDVESYDIHSSRTLRSVPNWFYQLKEESLANAGALQLMTGIWDEPDLAFLKFVIKQQPFEYRLGLVYYDRIGELSRRAIEEWVHMKDGHDFNKKIAMHWLEYIANTIHIDSKQLELYESGFSFSKGVFKYKDFHNGATELILYDNHELPIQVIKDYVKQNPTITRSELMTTFPSDLNEDYEVFIDPNKQRDFKDKADKMISRSTDNAQTIKCADGILLICDYWHPNSMPAFVGHARKLGFTIIDFN